MERNRKIITLLDLLHGEFSLEQYRKGELINTIPFSNGATNVGKQYMLSAAFLGGTAISTWYIGLIDATSGTPILNDADSMSSHGGWSEFTSYDEASRQIWTKALNTLNNTVASSSPAIFTISSGVADGALVGGGFLVSNNTKGGTSGTLWAHGLHANAVPVEATDVFRMNYTAGL